MVTTPLIPSTSPLDEDTTTVTSTEIGTTVTEPKYEVHDQSEIHQPTFELEDKVAAVVAKDSLFDRLYEHGKRKVQRNRELENQFGALQMK